MLDPQTGKEIIEDFLDVPEKNRPWAINIIVILAAIAVCMTTFFIFQTQKSEAVQRAMAAESELKSLRMIYVTEGKECPKLIQDAVEKRDLYWSTKFDNERDLNQKMLQEKAAKLEQELSYLRNETRKVKKRTETIRNTIGS